MKKLEDQYSWSELCDITIRKVNLKKSEVATFRKWFMARECLGYRFDYVLIKRAFNIWKELKNNLDHFVVISGREGLGKSTLSIQLASWVCPNFSTANICYDAQTFLSILQRRAKHLETSPDNFQSLVLDEGTELLSRESQNLTNKVLIKSFFIQRALKLLVIICIPNFHLLDSVVRFHRVRTLIEVIGRGKYKAICGQGIGHVAKEGALTKSVNRVKLRDGQFWHGYFTKEFPKTLSYEEYEKVKFDGIREALDRLREDLSVKKMVSASKTAKQLDITPTTLVTMIKAGKVKGKQIGAKWFISKREYDRLTSLPAD